MSLKAWLILSIACSFIIGCKSGPAISYCIMDSANLMLRCSDSKQVAFDLTVAQADNYGCMSPDDWQILLSWLKTDGKAKINSNQVYNALQQNPVINARLGSKLGALK